MIDFDTFCRLRQLHDEKGLKTAQIAEALNLDPKTVEKWIDRRTYQQRQGRKRSSKLDSFRGLIAAQLERHPYSTQQLFQQLRQLGYTGGYSILKDFVRQIRPVNKPAYLALAFAPGECAQVDWGSFGSVAVGSTRRRLSFFVMVLCHSRMMYVEFTLSEGMEQFLSCHRRAFEFLGGVPKKVMIDNLKVGVLSHPMGEKATFHPRYVDLAAHYGFEPVACTVRKANEKGRVENAVGYIKKNFLVGLDIPSFASVNPAAVVWRDTVANVRLHGETQRKPLDLFAEEKPRLRALPPRAYDCAVIRPTTATGWCQVTFETNRYSVPHLYASQKLTLKLYPEELLLYHHETLIATHLRSYDRHQRISNPEHQRELINQRRKARTQTILLSFLAMSPHAENYARRLEEKRLNAPHHIQRIVALSEIYGPQKVDQALGHALSFEAIGCEYVANLLEQQERTGVPASALHLTHRQDLLDLELPPADLTPYEPKT